jgi:hypothetical protein
MNVTIRKLRLLARASKEAYSDQPVLNEYYALPFANGATHATLFVGERNVVLAFRGTEPDSPGDLITDIKFRRRRLSHRIPGKFHRGFCDQLDSLYKQLVSALTPHVLHDRKPLYITGHSLGGALAVLFSARAFEEDPRILTTWRGTVTYGAPRVANRKGAQYLDDTLDGDLVQVRITQDRVPHLPPAVLGYRHAGEAILLDAVEAKVLSPRRKWLGRWSLILAFIRRVRAHSSSAYVRIITEYLNEAVRRVVNAKGRSKLARRAR